MVIFFVSVHKQVKVAVENLKVFLIYPFRSVLLKLIMLFNPTYVMISKCFVVL